MPGQFYPPTILSGVAPGMKIWEEEVFGPVRGLGQGLLRLLAWAKRGLFLVRRARRVRWNAAAEASATRGQGLSLLPRRAQGSPSLLLPLPLPPFSHTQL